MAVQIQMRRGTLSQWATANPTLADGEWGLETDTNKFKIGNGTDAWNSITTYSSLGIGTAGGTFAGTVNFGVDGTGQDVNFYSLTGGDHMRWDASEEQLVITGTNGQVALNVADGNALFADDVTITGSLTVNGATTTVSTTNTLVEDSLIELNTGASSNANDLGIVMERGSTGNNAIIAWDESADKFTMGTTTATGASTGDLSITAGTLVADLEGDVTGDVTGNASGTAATVTGAAQSAITSVGTLTGLTMGGELAAVDQVISRPIIKDYSETVHAGGNTGATVTLDETDGNVQSWTLNASCTFTMPSGSGLKPGTSMTLILTQDGSSRTGTFTNVKWAGGTAVTLSTGDDDVDILTFTTFNGGANPVWYGFSAGLDMG